MGLFKKNNKILKKENNATFNNEEVANKVYTESTIVNQSALSEGPIAINERKKIIFDQLHKLEKKEYQLTNLYLSCKIYSRVAMKDNEFNSKMFQIDKDINRFRKNYAEYVKKINNAKYLEEYPANLINELYYEYLMVLEYYKDILKELQTIQSNYYGHLRISTVGVCLNRTNDELEKINMSLSQFLDGFKGLNEAAEYVYYNSGETIVRAVKELLICIVKSKNSNYINKYNYQYFLNADDIITLKVSEWIDLYNKFKFIIKSVKDDNTQSFGDFMYGFLKFETRYVVLMMSVETDRHLGRLIKFE